MKAFQAHLKELDAGTYSRGRCMSLRKSMHRIERLRNGWSAPEFGMTETEINTLLKRIEAETPRVDAAWHERGKAFLHSPAIWRKLGARERVIVENLAEFRLVDMYDYGNNVSYFTPIFHAIATDGAAFEYYNVPWQSGGEFEITG